MELIEYPKLSGLEREAIVAAGTHSRCFDFMGNCIRIAGNHPGPLDSFVAMYENFVSDDTTPTLSIDYELGENSTLTITSNGHDYRMSDPDLIQYAFSVFTYIIVLNLRSHFIVHAGGVVRNNRALLLSGDSRMGKTTLVSHLVERGWGFLSDDIAPIKRGVAEVDPFPRRLSIRRGPSDRFISDVADVLVFDTPDDFRRLVDVKEMGGESYSGSVPLGAIVFLMRTQDDQVKTPMKFSGRVNVGLSRGGAEVEERLTCIDGVQLLSVGELAGMPLYLLDVAEGRTFYPKLQELIREFNLEITDLSYENNEDPDYSAEPVLSRIPTTAGIIELVKKMPGAFKQALISECFDGQLSRMIAELSGVVKDVPFYRLTPGKLDLTLDLVESLEF